MAFTERLLPTSIEDAVHEVLYSMEPFSVILLALISTLCYFLIQEMMEDTPDILQTFFTLVKMIPFVRMKIEKEIDNVRKDLEKDYFKEPETMYKFQVLPKEGLSSKEVLNASKEILQSAPFEWKGGKLSGGAYAGSDESYTSFLISVYTKAVWANPLHADVFPGVRKMEAEVVRMACALFNGDENTVGTMTCGGSESLILALKTYRDMAREKKGIRQPEIVASFTVHAALEKGSRMLGLKLIKVGVDKRSWKCDVEAMKRKITDRTIALIASTPEYSHGIIDDVESIAQLGYSYGIPVHVDCCLGGFILPFMDRAGYPIKPFDFRLPGVTSISADVHKFGNATKGASIIMYRTKELRHYQYFSIPDWPGGIYATPTIAGSRPGGLIAQSWAAMLHHGMDGYIQVTRDIIKSARYYKEKVLEIDGMDVFGDPLGPVVTLKSDKVNIFRVADILTEKGWHLQAVQNPPGLQLMFTSLQTAPEFVDELVNEIQDAVDFIKKNPSAEVQGLGKVYGTAASIPDKELIKEVTYVFLDSYYVTK